MFRLCMGTHFATCDHDAVHKICARSATRYTLLILLPRPGTHFIHTLKVITRYNICCHVCWKILFVVTRVVTCDNITYRRIFLGGQGHLSMGRENIKVVTAKM